MREGALACSNCLTDQPTDGQMGLVAGLPCIVSAASLSNKCVRCVVGKKSCHVGEVKSPYVAVPGSPAPGSPGNADRSTNETGPVSAQWGVFRQSFHELTRDSVSFQSRRVAGPSVRSPSVSAPPVTARLPTVEPLASGSSDMISIHRAKELDAENCELRAKVLRLELRLDRAEQSEPDPDILQLMRRNADLVDHAKTLVAQLNDARTASKQARHFPGLEVTASNLEEMLRMSFVATAWKQTPLGSAIEKTLDELKSMLAKKDSGGSGDSMDVDQEVLTWASIEGSLTPLPASLGKGKERMQQG